MNDAKQILETIISNFSIDTFNRFFREKSRQFVAREENYLRYNDDDFKNGFKLGEINFSDGDSLIICAFEVKRDLSERAGKKSQYEKAKNILKSTENQKFSAGIFIFYDANENFRFSLVYPEAIGTHRQWNNFRRFTYFVNKEFTNKTFLKQIGEKDFSKLDDVKNAFSVSAVTDLFYKEFFEIYNRMVISVKEIGKITEENLARDFVLLFAIRTIFLGFIQKKKWFGNDEKFIQSFFEAYKIESSGKNIFYLDWLSPLFFEALNKKFSPRSYLPNRFNSILQLSPYLNGELFKKKDGYDNRGLVIPDKGIQDFFDFLFAHSFTIEENSLNDEDLQLNPEFLGIIFERLVNKADGAVYTPRTEVDLMCRLSLVKWLQKNLVSPIKINNLYELFFRESKNEEDQKQGSFSQKEAKEILEKLGNLIICDPAVGSGAFLVGMMQVLDEVEQVLKKKYGLNEKNLFERKKQIIKDSLYGVEVKEWAVWICQLRLWLSLFVDAPDDLKGSFEPILPSLDFKVRQGDSLVQLVGSKAFPISGHNLSLTKSTKDKITNLKNFKLQYFDNKSELKDWELRQKELQIYEEIIDSEIKEKENELKSLRSIEHAKTMPLFNNDNTINQEKLEFNRDKISILENEKSELIEQKRALRMGGKPLVWCIEFSEVFAEKGGFDIIIGNPPYVRQEKIEDPVGKIKDKKEYKNRLEEMVKLDFSEDFSKKTKINAQSDLYTYFYIRGLRLLNSQGIHTFICSNSWLDVGYGVWLQDFLLKRCPVDLIIDNHAKRSFEAADVNTIISIIHAPQTKIDVNHLVKFVAFKKPFEESIFTENILAIENAKQVESNEILRVYPIATNDLQEAGMEYEENTLTKSGKYVGDKWGGKYLRAPDIFFTILEKGKDKLVKLGDIAEVCFGIKTGVNEFFYLTDEQIKQWNIEEEFLKPVIKSPRECKSILVNPKDLKYKIFMCNKSKEELKDTSALKYIEWGEKQKTEDGVLWKDVSSVQERKYWWGLGERTTCSFIVPCSFSDNFKIFKNPGVLVDKRMYEGNSSDDSVSVSLNSILFPLFMELGSRVGLGEGLLDVTVEEVQKIKIIDPKKVILTSHLLPIREIKSIFEECGIDPKSDVPIEEQEPKPMLDRAELDKIVFDALELSEGERKDVYRAVCRLVWNRISKANSV